MTPPLTTAHTFALEPLEARTLLSVTLDPAGLLMINGTDAADAIKLRPGHQPGSVIVKSSIPGDNDTYTDVTELVILGGDGNDKIKLNGLLTGTDGGPLAITIDGGDGHDRIKASQGPDTVIGGPGDDRINARGGDDTVVAGEGNDRINGGKGNDHISYESAPAPVRVNLYRSTAPDDGHGDTDKLKGFESITGSPFADQLTNSKKNPATINGNGGPDLLIKPIAARNTKSPTALVGSVTDAFGTTHRLILADDNNPDSNLDITDTLNHDGTFTVEQSLLESVLNAKLKKGATHSLRLRAEDPAGNATTRLIPITRGAEHELSITPLTPAPAIEHDLPTPGQPFPDGIYDMTVTATDVAGNTSDPSNTETITIDTLAPVIVATIDDTPPSSGTGSSGGSGGGFSSGSVNLNSPNPIIAIPRAVEIALAPDSDTGVHNSDGITNDTTPTIDIVLALSRIDFEVQPFVELTLNNEPIATIPFGPDMQWTADPLPEGVHRFRAILTPVAPITDSVLGRLLTFSTILTITIDTTPPDHSPTPSIFHPYDTGRSDSDGITNHTSPIFDVLSEDENQVTLVTKRIALVDEPAPPGTTDPTRPYDPDTDDLAIPVTHARHGFRHILNGDDPFVFEDGVYVITAQISDLAGNTAPISDPYQFTIDTTPPWPPILDLQPTSDSGFDNTDNITNDNTPTFDVTAQPDTILDLFVNGEPFIQTDPTTTETTEITLGE